MADGQEQTAEATKAPDVVSVGDDIAAAMKEVGWDGKATEDEQPAAVGDGDEGADEAEHADASEGDSEAPDRVADDGSTDDSDVAADGEDDTSEEAADAVEPPEHWSQADRDAFEALPDEAKPLYLDKVKSLERGYNAKFEAASEDIRAAQTVREVLAPWKDQLAREGFDEIAAVRRFVAVHDLLTRDGDQGMQWLAGQPLYRPKDPAATMKAIAAAWGVDVGASDEGQADDIIDPAANTKIAALEAKIVELEKHTSSSTEAEQQRRMSDAKTTFQAFTDAKDEAGKPKHPHFEQVRERMGTLMWSGAAGTLEDAYEQAVWSDPALRGDLLKQQQTAQKNGDDRKARLQRNKRASTKVKSDKSGGRAAPAQRSLRDEITANFDEAGIT